jgi:hypothetical protein
LSAYLFLANLTYTFDALGLLDFTILHVTDIAGVAAAVAAAVAGAVWGSLPRAGPASVERIERVAETLVRYCLGFILPIYGATKILDVQFRLPFVALDTPLGEASGMALTWRFSGYSYPYELLLGLGELGGAVLLFFRRTTTLGACILLPILANVAFLNYSHNIPVKLYSTCYLLMVCYLVGLDFPRLSALFLENKAFGPRPTPVETLSPRARTALAYGKVGFLVFAVLHAFGYILLADSTPSVLSGAWTVTRGEFLDSPQPAPLPWKKVFFEYGNRGVFVGSVKEADGGRPKRFRYEVGPDDRHLAITFNEPSAGPPFTGSYQLLDDRTLKLTGSLGERRVEVLLARQNRGGR